MEIKITFTGDIMCKKEFIEAYQVAETEEYHFDGIFDKITPFLKQSDYVVGNLETPIAGKELGYTKRPFNFNSPIEFGYAVKNAGIDLVSTANNHCLDRGIEGLVKTNVSLEEIGLGHIGTNNNANDEKSKIISIEGCKIGFLAYTFGTEAPYNGVYLSGSERYHVNLYQNQELTSSLLRRMYYSKRKVVRWIYQLLSILSFQENLGEPSDRREFSWRGKREISQEIKKLKSKGVDLIVMCLHAGGQYNITPRRRVIRFADFLERKGVQAIIINHEHLVQRAEFKKMKQQKLRVYCLGNFLGGAGVYYPPYDKMADYSVLLHLYLDPKTLKMRCTFSILKTIRVDEKKFMVVELSDLFASMNRKEDREKLIMDALCIYNRFMNTKLNKIDIQKEYDCHS